MTKKSDLMNRLDEIKGDLDELMHFFFLEMRHPQVVSSSPAGYRLFTQREERERAAKMVEEWVEGVRQPDIHIMVAEVRATADLIRNGE